MRVITVLALVLAVGFSGATFAQTRENAAGFCVGAVGGPPVEQPWVDVVEGTSRASVVPRVRSYAGLPWAAVSAVSQGTATASVSSFRVRAWAEGAGARVIVFAVAPSPDGTETETQIASLALALGESQEIRATEQYNARPLTVSLSWRK